jgi:hypothetical protein
LPKIVELAGCRALGPRLSAFPGRVEMNTNAILEKPASLSCLDSFRRKARRQNIVRLARSQATGNSACRAQMRLLKSIDVPAHLDDPDARPWLSQLWCRLQTALGNR